MKAIKIITHPYTVIVSFLAILISGQHLGGFYVLYILLALPYGAIHSVLALVGVALLFFGHRKYYGRRVLVKNIISILSLVLMFLSLFLFFYSDKQHYNYGTFYQVIPRITLFVFFAIATIFLLHNLIALIREGRTNRTFQF